MFFPRSNRTVGDPLPDPQHVRALRGVGTGVSTPRRRPRFPLALLLPLALLSPPAAGSLHAQWPGQITGQVLDARSGRAIPAASVEIDRGAGRVETDGSGGFRSRGLEPGRYRVVVRHFGYADGAAEVDVHNGVVSRVLLELEPTALALDTLRVSAVGRAEAGSAQVGRGRISAMGARTAGDVVLALPGVRLVERVPGGAQTVSLRGSGADQVLVLLDGIPLNDPVTGEADLSTIPAASIEEVTLLRGARSARYGPRAQGGAILIRTRIAGGRVESAVSWGSLGEFGARVDGGGRRPGRAWGAGAEARVLRGDFRFVNPAHAHPEGETAGEGGDGGEDASVPPQARRENADARQFALRGSAEGVAAGGDWNARLGLEATERGNPGRSFAPSRTARQQLRRGRASLSWRRQTGEVAGGLARPGADEVSFYYTLQNTMAEDPDPPFGVPYDDETRLHASGVRLELTRDPHAPRWSAVGGGAELRHQSVRSDLLLDGGEGGAGGASIDRVDVGVFVRGRVRLGTGGASPELSLVARGHRDGLGATWYPGHEATLTVPVGGLSLHLAHRSSFSPPTLGDQYFREGVGIVPNPDLRAERVPSEWEVGVAGAIPGERAALTLGAEAYRGDVRDMIIWAPDFRFIWSPRNVDVERSGLETWAGLHLLREGVQLSGSYSLSRITYGRSGQSSGGTSGVQLAYRPRHSATLSGGWEGGRWRGEVTGRYTGLRYPVPAAVNAMDPFWSVGANVSRSWSRSGWTFHPLARVERLLDRRDSHIFGFPEPGRTFHLEVRVVRTP